MSRRTGIEVKALQKIHAFRNEVAEQLEIHFSIPRTHCDHGDDIADALAETVPGIVDAYVGKVASGDFAGGAKIIRAALVDLKKADALVFMRSPSKAHMALLVFVWAPPNQMVDRDRRGFAFGTADCGVEERRRLALKLRRALQAAQQPIPDESEELGPPAAEGDTTQSRMIARAHWNRRGVPHSTIGG